MFTQGCCHLTLYNSVLHSYINPIKLVKIGHVHCAIIIELYSSHVVPICSELVPHPRVPFTVSITNAADGETKKFDIFSKHGLTARVNVPQIGMHGTAI
jgi:hypothetical protein